MSDRQFYEIDYGAGYLRDTPDEQGRIKFRGWLVPAEGVVALDAIDREKAVGVIHMMVGNPNPVMPSNYFERLREVVDAAFDAALGVGGDDDG